MSILIDVFFFGWSMGFLIELISKYSRRLFLGLLIALAVFLTVIVIFFGAGEISDGIIFLSWWTFISFIVGGVIGTAMADWSYDEAVKEKRRKKK